VLTTIIFAAIIGLIAFMLIPSKKSPSGSASSPIETQVAAMSSTPSQSSSDLNEKLSLVEAVVREKHLEKRKREALEEFRDLLGDGQES
jgi:hypothetical protein